MRKSRRTCGISLSTIALALVQTRTQSRDVTPATVVGALNGAAGTFTLKTKLSAGKHFGETGTKSGSYISRDECCTVLPNHTAVARVTFSPKGGGSQSVPRGSLGIRGYSCVMTTFRFNVVFV